MEAPEINHPSFKRAVLRGAKRTPKIVWQFCLMIVPCILAIQIFEKTGLIVAIAQWFAPAMSLFKLPGEAALVLISAQFSVFSAIAVATALNLTVRQLTIAFTFTGCLHNIFLETAVVKRVGANILVVFAFRLISAVASALLVSLLV